MEKVILSMLKDDLLSLKSMLTFPIQTCDSWDKGDNSICILSIANGVSKLLHTK